MDWLNYHHLLYFWTVAKEGSMVEAAKHLGLAQPTISGQVRQLEESLGVKLFDRVGRRLELTDEGHFVFRYADEIFGLGRELVDTVKRRSSGPRNRLQVGISDLLPKLISHRLLAPALALDEPVQLSCHEDKTERLLAELAVRGLDLVLADSPIGPNVKIKAFNHLLGDSGIGFFATEPLTRKYRRGFPESLDEAPMLLPIEGTVIRRDLDRFFESVGVRPRLVAEFHDSALMKVFGQAGEGLFCSPIAIEKEIRQQYGVRLVGRTEDVRERFYAITVERRIKHPAVIAISTAAASILKPQQSDR